MARKRQIDPAFWTHPLVGKLSLGARLTFIGMWSNADDEGRVRGEPGFLRVTIFPYDTETDDTVKGYRDEVVAQKFCVVYTNGDSPEEYVFLPTFEKQQTISRKFKSKLPPPPQSVLDHAHVSATSVLDHAHISATSSVLGNGIGNGNGNGIGIGNDAPLLQQLQSLTGWEAKEDDTAWLSELFEEYPHFNVGYLRACRDFHKDNTGKKGGVNWKSRLRNWMIKDAEIKARNGERIVRREYA